MRKYAALVPVIVTAGLSAVPVLWLAGHALADTVIVSATAQSSSSLQGFNQAEAITFSSPSGLNNFYGTQVTAVTGTGGGAMLGSFATVAHALGSARSVTMDWRVRTLNESFKAEPGGNPTQPPLWMDGLYFGNASDVVELTGFAPGEAFVLQMSYTTNSAWYDEAEEIRTASIHLAWLDPVTGLWTNASAANINNSAERVTNYLGGWAAYRDSQIAAGKDPLAMGSWGVDATNNVTWMVLNHNSQFVVTPEPPSVLLAVFGAGFVAWRYGRRPRHLAAGRFMRRADRASRLLGVFLAAFLPQIVLYSYVGTAFAG